MFTHRELGVVVDFYCYFFKGAHFLSDLETTGFLLNGSDACGGIHPRQLHLATSHMLSLTCMSLGSDDGDLLVPLREERFNQPYLQLFCSHPSVSVAFAWWI